MHKIPFPFYESCCFVYIPNLHFRVNSEQLIRVFQVLPTSGRESFKLQHFFFELLKSRFEKYKYNVISLIETATARNVSMADLPHATDRGSDTDDEDDVPEGAAGAAEAVSKEEKSGEDEGAINDAAATPPFDRLSDEMALKIIAMASNPNPDRHDFLVYPDPEKHDFLVDVLCKVSVRFRRLATDFSLWKDSVMIYVPCNDLSKLDFVIREALNSATKTLTILSGPFINPEAIFPYQYLRDLTTKFPNLKVVRVIGFRVESGTDIPAPWKEKRVAYRYFEFERD